MGRRELGAALVALGDRLGVRLFMLGAKLMDCGNPTCIAEVAEGLREVENDVRRARKDVERLLL